MNIVIKTLDHLVLTVKDIEASFHFYSEVLGMEIITFKEGRKALKFGNMKINLHEEGKEFKPHVKFPTAGSSDICLISLSSISQVQESLRLRGISIEEGPVERTGAKGPIISVYIRDPDKNLIEISNYK